MNEETSSCNVLLASSCNHSLRFDFTILNLKKKTRKTIVLTLFYHKHLEGFKSGLFHLLVPLCLSAPVNMSWRCTLSLSFPLAKAKPYLLHTLWASPAPRSQRTWPGSSSPSFLIHCMNDCELNLQQIQGQHFIKNSSNLSGPSGPLSP